MYKNKKIIAVITCRAGSKGLPGKNHKFLHDLPLFLWSVEAARKSKYIDAIIISSNCPECKKYYDKYIEYFAEQENGYKIKWIQRPDEFATATSKNEDALIHVLDNVEEDYDYLINLQPTSPCRINRLVDKTIETCIDGSYDSLLTGTKDTPFLWRKKGDKWIYDIDKNNCCNRKMRQQFSEEEFVYHDCGNLYLTDANVLKETQCRIGINPCVYEVEGVNGLQIDTIYDFKLIENMTADKTHYSFDCVEGYRCNVPTEDIEIDLDS